MEFSKMIDSLEEYKIKGEKETTWKNINTLFSEINEFIKTAPTDKIFHLNKYSNFYFSIANSQRSILVGTTTRLLISMAKILGSENVYFYEYLKEALNICGKANNLIYKYGNMLLEELAKQKQFSEKIKCKNLIFEKSKNLNKKLRFSLFKAVLAHKNIFLVSIFDKLIESGRVDKAVEIRNLFKNIESEKNNEQKVVRSSLLRRQIQTKPPVKCSPIPKKVCVEKSEIKNSEDEIFTPQRLKQYLDKYTKIKKIENPVFETKKEIIKAEKLIFNNQEQELTKDKLNKEELTKDKLNKEELTKDKLNKEELTNDKLNKQELTNDKLNKQELTNDKLNKQELTNDKLNKQELTKDKLNKQELTKDKLIEELDKINKQNPNVHLKSFFEEADILEQQIDDIDEEDELFNISYVKYSSNNIYCDESINNRTDEQLIKEPVNPLFHNKLNSENTMKIDESVVEGNERVVIDFDDNMPIFDREAKKTLDELLKKEINPELFNQKISVKNDNAKIKLPFKSNKFEGLSLIENDFHAKTEKSEIIPYNALKEEDSSFSEENIKKLSKSLNDMSIEKKSIHIDSVEGIERSERSFFSQFSVPELIDFDE